MTHKEGWRVEIMCPFSSSMPTFDFTLPELKLVSHKERLSAQRDSNTKTKLLKKEHHETLKSTTDSDRGVRVPWWNHDYISWSGVELLKIPSILPQMVQNLVTLPWPLQWCLVSFSGQCLITQGLVTVDWKDSKEWLIWVCSNKNIWLKLIKQVRIPRRQYEKRSDHNSKIS